MAINWGEAEEKAGGNFKDYAPAGVYKVKVAGIDIHEAGNNGSIAQDFKLAEDDYQYPKITHWLSFKNENWRFVHNRELMMLLGATKEDAQKAVELCESKGTKENIAKAYQQAYERLIKKNSPEVEIETWPDGKYSRADFTSTSVRMSHPDDEPYQKQDSAEDIIDSGDAITDDLDIPF